MSDILHPYGRARVAADESRSGFPHAGTRGLFLVEDADNQLVPYIGHPTGAQTSFASAAFYAAQRAIGRHWVTDPTYGAVGDGTTDDYAAIQAACDAAEAASGGLVIAPFKSTGYALSHYVHVPPGVTFDGNYAEFIPLAGSTLGEYGAIFMVGAEHPNDTGVAEVTAAANAHIRRVVYEGGFTGDPTTGTAIHTDANFTGLCSNPIVLFNNVGGSAKECHIYGAKNIGIGIHGSRNVEVTRNRIRVARWQGVGCPQTRPADGCHIHDNYFEDIGTYACDVHSPSGGVGNTVELNELVRCGQLAKSQVGPIRVLNNFGSIDNRGTVGYETAVLVSASSASDRGSQVSGNRLTGVQDFLSIGANDLTCADNKITSHASRRPTAIVNIAASGALVKDNVFRYGMLGTRGIEFDSGYGGRILNNTLVCSVDANDRYLLYAPTVTERLEIAGNTFTVESDGSMTVPAMYLTDCSEIDIHDNTWTTQNPGAARPSLMLNNCTGVVHGNKGNSYRRIQGTGTVKHYANSFSAVHVSDTVKDWYEPLTSGADPNGTTTSRRAGDICINTFAAPDKAYIATDAGSTVWVALN